MAGKWWDEGFRWPIDIFGIRIRIGRGDSFNGPFDNGWGWQIGIRFDSRSVMFDLLFFSVLIYYRGH